jgi:hypothetical protein
MNHDIHYARNISADDSDAYNFTQCNARDGDVIVFSDAVAVMVEAWPCSVCGITGVLHEVGNGFTIDTLDDGKYVQAHNIARGEAGLAGIDIPARPGR